MAEFVELRLEEMLPELEQMKRVQLFTDKEVKEIVKRRRDFEYKLQKRSKQKEDYLKYVQYEINLLSLLRIRRQKIGYMHKKPEIDYAIANRINKLFTLAVSRFPDDTKLWLSHIDFCKRMRWTSSISRIFSRMLALKGSDPSLWVLAAKWEFEENKSATNARNLLLRAIRNHPKSMSLYTEAFRLELLETERLRKRREVLGISCEADLPDEDERKDAILDGQLAVIVYNSSKSAAKSASDLVAFLTVAGEFDFTREIRQMIFEDLQKNYEKDEATWDTVARSLLEKDSVIAGEEHRHLKMKQRLKICIDKYEEGISVVDTPKMWNLFVDTLSELMKNDSLKSRVSSIYKDVCERALAHRKISENHVLNWVTRLQEEFELQSTVGGILEKAVDLYPKSEKLWLKYIEVLLKQKLVQETPLFVTDTGTGPQSVQGSWFPGQSSSKQQRDESSDSDDSESEDESVASFHVPGEFWKALKNLGDRESTLGLWDMVISSYIDFYQTNESRSLASIIDNLLKKALNKEPPVSSTVKPRVLEWIYSSKGLAEAEKFYKENCNTPPLVLEFHYKIMELQMKTKKTKSWNPEKVRKYYEIACEQLGSRNPDLWLRYIQFELEHGDAGKVGNLHYRAKLSLESSLADRFLTQYTLLSLQ